MGTKGLTHFDAGEYAKAVEQFEQAYGLYRAPTLGLYSARALAKLGRLTQASARYLDVMNMTLPKDAPAQFAEAQSAAAAERTELIQRIPRLRVEIAGSGDGNVTVNVDGVATDLEALAAGIQLNPGAHEVRGQLGDKPAKMSVALQEGETRTITLDFASPSPAAVAPAPGSAGPASTPAVGGAFPPAGPDGRAAATEGSAARTFGWVLIGTGIVGVGVGAVTGGIASQKKTDLEGVCRPSLDHCPESERRVVDEYNTLRTVSTVGFVAGGIGLAGGGILLLSSRNKNPKPRAQSVAPWVGVASAGMRGWF